MQSSERFDGREIETDKVDQTHEIQNVTNTSVRNDNLENSMMRGLQKINESQPIGQEHDTLPCLIDSHVNNTSGKSLTNQTHFKLTR